MSETFDTARFTFDATPLPGLWVAREKPQADARGAFVRLFCSQEWRAIGVTAPLEQINQSITAVPGTLRGMHFQRPPHAETKIIRCVAGEVYDVAVDVRANSPTYLQWFGLRLSGGDGQCLVVPPGFAHGFQALAANSALMYFVTARFSPDAEDGLNPQDPDIAIAWPLPCALISDKDAARPLLAGRSFKPVQLDATVTEVSS